MKKIKYLGFFIVFLLGSCTIDRDISKDPRLEPLLKKQIATKAPLRLYEIDFQRSGNSKLYDLTAVDFGDKGLVGIVGIGTKVNFDRAMLRNGGGGSWERIEGHLRYKGTTYPIAYNLGLTAYPNGWRRVYKYFEVMR